MSPSIIQHLLSLYLKPSTNTAYPINWNEFSAYFNWTPPSSFKEFMSSNHKFQIPGGLLQVASSQGLFGPDTVTTVFESELEIGNWPISMIPFWAIGNGDYYCISKIDSCIYIVYYNRETNRISPDFKTWLETELKNNTL